MWPFDHNNHHQYQRFAEAYDTGNYDGIDPNHAANHFQQFAQNAPTETQQQLYEQHFAQLSDEERTTLAQHMPAHYNVDPNDPSSMAQGFTRMGQENPQILQRIFSHPILLGCMVGLTGLVAKHMLERQQRSAY